MERHPLSVTLAAALALAALVSPRAGLAVGGQFGFEFAIDAPWRLEPVRTSDGGLAFGPIPIVVVFHDAVFEEARSEVGGYLAFPKIGIGDFREIRVIERIQGQPQAVTIVKANQVREIERKQFVSTKTKEPDHELCSPAPERSCRSALRISGSHEWHAVFWYTPRAPVTPGRNIHLEVTAVTSLGGLYLREWRQFLVVHAGEAPLPRFGDDWLYGDLHYHSQSTDNEGESGYAYRNVVRALGALGMDFVFATDHASNGVQVDGKIEGRYCADRRGEPCFEARDLNVNRFAAAKSILYGRDGANEAIVSEASRERFARLRSANVVPQVYMGEEVDAVPEISAQEQAEGVVRYGDGLAYRWPDPSGCIAKHGLERCRETYSAPPAPRDHRTFLVLDEQGIPVEETVDDEIRNETVRSIVKFFTPDETSPRPSRQHLVYFPRSPLPNAEGWIASDTGPFGGGGKRLPDVLNEVNAGGFAFLAHPLSSSRPGGPGPDIVPYSDTELGWAWASPAILGLQFWNENDRHYSAPDVRSPTVVFTGAVEGAPRTTRFSYNWPFQGHEYGNFPWSWQHGRSMAGVVAELYHGAFTWDRYLRKGLDPQQTAALSWLPRGEPRKWFMAGGSDAHGDLNYRRYGNPCRSRWCDVPVGDTAIGNPRNLVSMSGPAPGLPAFAETDRPATSGPRRYGNREVLDALRLGSFSVTDGPAIRIAVDRNRNGAIDDGDLQMGSTYQFFPGEHVPLLVEWFSTPEFGPIDHVDVFVGNPRVTFAPKDHGAGIPPSLSEVGGYERDPSGVLKIALADVFGRYDRQDAPPGAGYHGVARIFLGPAKFALASADQALSYVRAVARTIGSQQAADLGLCAKSGTAGSQCGNRYAFSNPIWAKYVATCPPPSLRPAAGAAAALDRLGRLASPFADADSNGTPDACERDLPNPCPTRGPRGPLGDVVGDLPDIALDHTRTPAEGPRPAKPIPSSSCQQVSEVAGTR